MKKIKKRVIIISLIGLGVIFVSVDWNNFVIRDFNSHIKNQLRIAEMESSSNSDYISLGPNMVINYSGQVENKGQIYEELVDSVKTLLSKNAIYLNNYVIKVDFNTIKIMSGIKYYPVEIYTLSNENSRELKYSFYISLDGNMMPKENTSSNIIGIDKSVNMVNSFGNNSDVNASYDLSPVELSNYNNKKDFTDNNKKLYYRLCEMAELNIFGTTYITGYNFVTNIAQPVSYNGFNYYEMLMYSTAYKNNNNAGLVYKFYMTASGNIVSYNDINKENTNNNLNNEGENKENKNTPSDTKNNLNNTNNKENTINSNKPTNLENNSSNNQENKSINKTIKSTTYNNLYKLVIEYEDLMANTNQDYKFNVISSKEVKGSNYYNVNIIGQNNLVDEFYISENGSIYRKNKK